MYPIYVLEGPDGSGKTTLAKFMAEKFNAHYMHLTYRWKDRMFHYHWAALEHAIRISKTRPVVIDRWWPSINIYDDEFRKRRTFPQAGRMLDRAGMAAGVIYIACMPGDMEELIRDFDKRKAAGGEMYDSVQGVALRYVDWWSTMTDRVDLLTYDRFTHGQNMDLFIAQAFRQWAQVVQRIPHWFFKNRMLGGNAFAPEPKLMIVGEKSNPKGRHQVWPFFEHANSSLFLTECLDEAGVDEYDIVWANAISADGWTQPKLLKQVYDWAHPKQVIALGNKADHVCWAAGLRTVTEKLHHPAYAKRFQSGPGSTFRAEYVEDLRRLANEPQLS